MGKAVGYIVALVAIGLVIYIVATHKKPQAPAPHVGGATGPVAGATMAQPATDTYASLAKFAIQMRTMQEEGIKKSNGMAPPPTYTMLNNRTFSGTGKVLRTENNLGRGVIYLDLNDDGQYEAKVDLGGLPVPEGITEGVSVDFKATATNATMDGDRLVLDCSSAPTLIKLAGAK